MLSASVDDEGYHGEDNAKYDSTGDGCESDVCGFPIVFIRPGSGRRLGRESVVDRCGRHGEASGYDDGKMTSRDLFCRTSFDVRTVVK